MRKYVFLLVKGFIIGLGKIIPGVSGAMLAISLGVYEKGINAINHFFSDIKNNIKFLLPLGIGATIAIIYASKIIIFLLINYYLPTMLLFIGLIMSSLPMLKSKVKSNKINNLIIIITFITIISLGLFKNNNKGEITFISLFIVGIIDAVTMVIPGISGTAILMIIGYYNIVIETLSELDYKLIDNLPIILPFVLGLIIGVIGTVKVVSYLFNYHKEKTYASIIGFGLSSIILLFIETFNKNYGVLETIVGLLFLVIGFNLGKDR